MWHSVEAGVPARGNLSGTRAPRNRGRSVGWLSNSMLGVPPKAGQQGATGSRRRAGGCSCPSVVAVAIFVVRGGRVCWYSVVCDIRTQIVSPPIYRHCQTTGATAVFMMDRVSYYISWMKSAGMSRAVKTTTTTTTATTATTTTSRRFGVVPNWASALASEGKRAAACGRRGDSETAQQRRPSFAMSALHFPVQRVQVPPLHSSCPGPPPWSLSRPCPS